MRRTAGASSFSSSNTLSPAQLMRPQLWYCVSDCVRAHLRLRGETQMLNLESTSSHMNYNSTLLPSYDPSACSCKSSSPLFPLVASASRPFQCILLFLLLLFIPNTPPSQQRPRALVARASCLLSRSSGPSSGGLLGDQPLSLHFLRH